LRTVEAACRKSLAGWAFVVGWPISDGIVAIPQFSPHSFRVATVTDLLEQNVPLEDVQYLAGHADPRTTRIYDRRRRKVTRNIVERISI
jgi:integrase/recombinase XerD